MWFVSIFSSLFPFYIFTNSFIFKFSPQYTYEGSIPYSTTRACLLSLEAWQTKELNDPKGLRNHFPIEIRFTDKDNIWLSPTYGVRSAYIGIIQYRLVFLKKKIESISNSITNHYTSSLIFLFSNYLLHQSTDHSIYQYLTHPFLTLSNLNSYHTKVDLIGLNLIHVLQNNYQLCILR